ncbi:hypothetical protein QR680_015730 [Steinernema hermaphroditum]|uniref:Uncharacterized protein n=1 Tax=Steinernema hermaphroditum TaxID=289476 RepID=A0AA39H8S4_9BILA|nr:hypothetical protein QR680_015730 [Steinernema hermaphroditum]
MIDWNSHAVIDSVSQHIYLPLLTLLGILNLFIGSFAIFIVATKSPRSTRTYNALLLNILFWSFAADFFQAILCQFDAHWPVPCFRAHGIVTLFNFGETVLDILATLIVIIYCNMIIAAALPVSFRCAQLLYRSTMKRVPRWGGILYCMCWHLAVGGAGLYLYTVCIVPADIYRDNTIEYHQVTCVTAKSTHKTIMVYGGLIGFAFDALSLIAYLFVSNRKVKTERRLSFSQHTENLQKIFTRNLSIVTFVPLCFFTIPFIIFIFAFDTLELYSNYIMYMTELLMCFHNLLVSVVTLRIYSAYRKATNDYMRKLLAKLKLGQVWSNSNESQSVVMYIK